MHPFPPLFTPSLPSLESDHYPFISTYTFLFWEFGTKQMTKKTTEVLIIILKTDRTGSGTGQNMCL